MFFDRFPTAFQMATFLSPIPCSTVIWFERLEFKSTGFGYDMILLSVKGPGGARIVPPRLRAPRTPQADPALGRPTRGGRGPEARDVQACGRKRGGLHQRMEHRTATSILPLEFRSFMLLCTFFIEIL